MPDEKKQVKKPDVRFWAGFALIIFLVLANSYGAPIPWYLVAIPALIMGVDLESIVKSFRGK